MRSVDGEGARGLVEDEEDGGFFCWVVVVDAPEEMSRMGFGSAKTPQFVKPRTTPPRWRTMVPAVLAILRWRLAWRGMRREGVVLFYFGDAAGSDLVLSARVRN